MKTTLRVIAILILLAILAIAALIFVPIQRTGALEQLPADYTPPKDAGRLVAVAGDCMACHTAQGGKPFAGGLAVASPFGTIYSTNITPDKETGIGNYTLDDFRAALYDGINKAGVPLYPAMPYPSYRKMSEKDVRALYDYLMHEVAPVHATPPRTALIFPFNQRWGIRVWDWVALPKAGFQPPTSDAKLNRGAYLVEGLAHCGACHTPRSKLTFAEDGYDSSARAFLAGAVLNGVPVPDLRAAGSDAQKWTAAELAALLATGRSPTTGVTGEMALAVQHSFQYLPASDVEAIAAYLQTIKEDRPVNGVAAARAAPEGTTAALNSASPDLKLGARLYLDNCSACHFTNAKGANSVFPSLDGNAMVVANEPGGLISVILNGAAIPSTALRPERLAMPGFGWRLNDEEVAALATFVRTNWSNNASAVTAAQVAKLRSSSDARQ